MMIDFLKEVMKNNNRPWFQEHKDEYLAAKAEFEAGVVKAIARITEFDDSIAHVTVKDATYRFYRDTRFSPDKSPIRTISVHISMPMARKRCVVVTISIWNQTIVCLLLVITGCPLTF